MCTFVSMHVCFCVCVYLLSITFFLRSCVHILLCQYLRGCLVCIFFIVNVMEEWRLMITILGLVMLQFSTGGLEDFRPNMTPALYRNAQSVIIMFDCTDPTSQELAFDRWLSEIRNMQVPLS